MGILRKVINKPKVFDVFKTRPSVYEPFTMVCEQIMRGPSPLTPGERELIGAFVSALNSCSYCHDTHISVARSFGLDESLTRALVAEISTAPVDERLKPILEYVRKLTKTPERVMESDARRVYDAGWDDDGLHDAVAVCCLFNFMNRFVFGFGIEGDENYYAAAGPRLKEMGYLASSGMGKKDRDDYRPSHA